MKKLLVMLLAVSMVLTMAFSFAACGEEEDASESSSQAPESSKEESVVESSDAESSDAESSDAESSDAESSDAESSDAESSDAESSDAESSDAESSDAESSDAVSSEEESVVESSEEEPVVESTEEVPSESESETPDPGDKDPSTGSPVVVPAGKTNYAKGASYTISKNLTPIDPAVDPGSLFLYDAQGATTYELWGDINLTKLTDGITVAGPDFNPNGALEGVTVAFVGTNAIFEYIIDLGETKSDINSIVFCGVRDGVANKNNRGFNTVTTMIYASDTLGAWGTKLNATFSSEEIEGAPLIKHQENEDSENVENFTYTYTLDSAATGRYVRILTSSPVYVLQFDEIMVLN